MRKYAIIPALICIQLHRQDDAVSRGTLLFVLEREFAFREPIIQTTVTKDSAAYCIRVSADCVVKGLALDMQNTDCIFSDIFFTLSTGEERVIYADMADMTYVHSLADFEVKLTVRCLHTVLRNK